MIDNGDTDYKLIWQGQDTMVFRLTGWRADVEMFGLTVDSDYRLIISMDSDECSLDFMESIENRVVRLDVMDYKAKYMREGQVRMPKYI